MTFVLDPALPVLLRPDGAVQVGWDPRRAVLVHPPSGLSAAAMATVLRAMAVPTELTELHHLALRHGLDDEAGFDDVVYALLAVGVVRERTRDGRAAGRTLSIRVHGAGPLSELVAEGLRCSGARVGRSSHANAAGAPTGVDLMVLTDSIAAEQRIADVRTRRGKKDCRPARADCSGIGTQNARIRPLGKRVELGALTEAM